MKLKANINGVDYELTQGLTLKEEYNETLDSGSIIIPQVKEIDLKPFTSVFIHSIDKEYRGYANKGEKAPIIANGGISNYSTGLLKPDLVDLYIGMQRPAPDFWILEDEGVGIWSYFYHEYNILNYTQCRYLVTLYIDLVLSDGTTRTFKLGNSNGLAHGKKDENLYLIQIDDENYKIKVLFNNEENNPQILIPYNFYDEFAETTKQVLNVIINTAYYQEREKNVNFFIYIDKEIREEHFDITSLIANFKVLYRGYWDKYTIFNVRPTTDKSMFMLDIRGIYGEEKSLQFDYNEANERYECYFDNSDFDEIDNIIFNNCFITLGKDYPLPSFFKHLLVDNFTDEVINITEDLRTYKITLMSETKSLEKIQLPNISITQSLNVEKRRTCWFYLKQFIELYSPKIKVVYDEQNQLWEYQNKFKIDESLKELFDNVNCPEMSLTNPTLKDVLSRIMVVKDCIPYVKNGVIHAMDLTQRKGEFIANPNVITSITSTMSSESYTTNTRREYSQAISQESSGKLVEYLGFRNSDSALMTLNNIRLETRFPIYKINKLYLCYYKSVKVIGNDGEDKGLKVFLCKQDITKLILQNKVRNSLSRDWIDFQANPPQNIDEMAEYRLCTLGYSIGSNLISGWGETYNYPYLGWFDKTKTYIENIINLIDEWYAYGTNFANNYGQLTNDGVLVYTTGNWLSSIVTPFTSSGQKIKSFFFELDYNPLYDGAVIHSKDNYVDDEITTNDNSSSALSILETDGLFEKEKVNRLGNKIYRITCRYNSLEELEQNNHVLGSVYKDDIIIYSREIQIYDNCVFAIYLATKDYVLKNFFTSVFAKLRTYNFMTYDESVSRAENVKKNLLLSPTNYYYENDSIENILFLSAFSESQIPINIDTFEYPNKINCGYFTIGESAYLSDINSFTCGYSLCFNIKMYDNVTGGVYINEMEVDVEQSGDVKGTHQKWNIVVADNEDAFIENIGAYVCHIETEEIYKDKPRYLTDTTKQDIYDIYKERLFKLPYFDFTLATKTNSIGGVYNICKDNKEVLNYTFQYEPYTINEDILYSHWLMKLSDLLSVHHKWQETFTLKEGENVDIVIEQINGVEKFGLIYPEAYPKITLRIKEEDLSKLTSNVKIKSQTSTWHDTVYLSVTKTDYWLEYTLQEIINFDGNNLIIKALRKFAIERFMSLRPVDWSQSIVDCVFVKKDNSPSGYIDFVYTNKELDELGDVNYHPKDNGKDIYLTSTQQVKTYYKNMFVFTSTDYLRKTLVYDELNPNKLPSNISDTELKVSQVFTTQLDDNSIPHIKVDTSLLPSEAKSVQYWYLDSDGLLKFVFGVNLKENMSKIYISTLSNRNLKVYDYLHNHIGNVSNLVENNEPKEKLQHYTLKK